MTHCAIDTFKSKLLEFGIPLDGEPIVDGRLHKYNSTAWSSNKNPADWYVLFFLDSGVLAGSFGSFRLPDHPSISFCSTEKSSMTAEEQEELKRKNQESQKIIREESERINALAAKKANYLWNMATLPPSDFPYLKKKKLDGSGLRYLPGIDNFSPCLLVPLYNEKFELINVERIYENGDKRGLTGGQRTGAFYFNGDIKHATFINLCEGWADAETITLANGNPSIASMGASNLLIVGGFLKSAFPSIKVDLYADQDHLTGGITSEWETFMGGEVYLPSTKDFNDLFVEQGIDAVKKEITPKRLPTLGFFQLAALDIPPPNFYVDNFILQGSAHFLVGPTSVGKSYYAIWLALCMALGRDFLGRKVPERKRVLYLDFELGTSLFHYRANQYINTYNLVDDGDFHLDVVPFDLIANFNTNLGKRQMQLYVEKELEKVDFLIIDNYGKVSETVDHSETHKIWAPIFHWMQRLCKVKGKTILLIGHTLKDRVTIAGPTQMLNDMDIVFKIEKDFSYEDNHTIVTEIDKPRTIAPEFQKPFRSIFTSHGWNTEMMDRTSLLTFKKNNKK